jgi:hypothetical protein
MNLFLSHIRRPVRRERAEQYLLITLLSFAFSVTLTRLFLSLTGYPQLGGGGIHIAHVLWGGLLLFLASLAPLMVCNRSVYRLGAILSGLGVGLFIDEVGKFITANNNYFYPLAAPIIYAFFLLTVLLYLRVRRPPSLEARAELFRVFDAMEEVLEHDLDQQERIRLENHLKYVSAQSDQPDLVRLADSLLTFLASDAVHLVPVRSSYWEGWYKRWVKFEQRWINPFRLRAIISGGLLALGAVAIITLVRMLPIGSSPTSLERVMTHLIAEGRLSAHGGLNWFAARLALQISVGLLVITAAVLFMLNKVSYGISLGQLGLLLSLTTVDLLIFYFDQFSTIITAVAQFILLILIIYYRRRYFHEIQPGRSL